MLKTLAAAFVASTASLTPPSAEALTYGTVQDIRGGSVLLFRSLDAMMNVAAAASAGALTTSVIDDDVTCIVDSGESATVIYSLPGFVAIEVTSGDVAGCRGFMASRYYNEVRN